MLGRAVFVKIIFVRARKHSSFRKSSFILQVFKLKIIPKINQFIKDIVSAFVPDILTSCPK